MKQECCNINEIIQEFYDYLKAFVFSRTKDKSVAEDIVQNVMVKLVESYHKDTEITNIKAWLFQVSRNCIADYYKANPVEHSNTNESVFLKEETYGLPKLVTSDYIIPMIRLLPKKYAIPLEKSDIDKIPQQTIANALNLSLSATKMRIQRGRVKLREMFVECCNIEYNKEGQLIGCTVKSDCVSLNEIKKDLNCKLHKNND